MLDILQIYNRGEKLKKYLFLIPAIFACAPAIANDINPYFKLMLTGSVVNNDLNVVSDYSFGGVTHYINTMSDDTHSDFAFGVNTGFGVKTDLPCGGALRMDLTFDWTADATDNNDFDFAVKTPYTHNFETTTSMYDIMLNMYYDFTNRSPFTPFIMAGLGYGHMKIETLTTGTIKSPGDLNIATDMKSDNFIWNIGAGVSYRMSDNISIDLMYRYTDYQDTNKNMSLMVPGLGAPMMVDADFDVSKHEFMLGMRYAF